MQFIRRNSSAIPPLINWNFKNKEAPFEIYKKTIAELTNISWDHSTLQRIKSEAKSNSYIHNDEKFKFILKKNAAVLIPLVDSASILFTKRSTRLSTHTGEISFPGGMYDDVLDKTLQDTAVRETHEELGIPKENIKILGKLWEFPNKTMEISVTPYVGYINLHSNEEKDLLLPMNPNQYGKGSLPVDWNKNINLMEVAEVFSLSLESILKCSAEYNKLSQGIVAPVFRSISISPPIWGLTAVILDHFIQNILIKIVKS